MSNLASFKFMLNTNPNDIIVKVGELKLGEHIIGDLVKQVLQEHPDRTFVGLEVLTENLNYDN